jgi:signal transduction histidine kinase
MAVRSLRTRLLALWLMLATSAGVTGYLLLEFYQQSANAQVSRAEDAVARGCRDIGDRYAFFVTGWTGAAAGDIDDALKRQLTEVVQAALLRATGVEGGLWQPLLGAVAYAYPTYEGSGPKTDVPAAELSTIRQVNAEALRNDRPITVRQTGQSQVLIVHACPLVGPLPELTAWTMTRVFVGQGRAYNQFLLGLAALSVTVLGSALWLGRILFTWSRKIARLETALANRDRPDGVLPALPPTGERELDRLVDALNAAGTKVAEERRRAVAAERLAAVGRLAAGLAHEIRNPIAAMRLKAENALAASDDSRRTSALQSILDQVGRLDGLLRDLLTMTQQKRLSYEDASLPQFFAGLIEAHRELAAANGVRFEVGTVPDAGEAPQFDIDQMRRALDNLVLNGVQNTPAGGSVTLDAAENDGILRLRVSDTGAGIPNAIRDRLFEPFVTGRADGTGLGLAIVRQIARAHGGDVHLVPSVRGAVFEIEVPWRPS